MENSANSRIISQPKLIPTFVAGFNAVANNIHLIVFPILIDLLFWLGPLVRVRELFGPSFEQSLQEMAKVYPAETVSLLEASKDAILQFFTHFNVLFALRSYPVGIPSLMVGIAPLNNPLGNLAVLEIGSLPLAFGLLFSSLILGVICGGLFFGFIARVAIPKKEKFSYGQMLNEMKNGLVYFVLVALMATGILLPSICLISTFSMYLPTLGTIPYFVLGLILVWLLMPFAFSAHGIFARQMTPVQSIRTSFQLVRKYLPGTGLFLLMAILMSQGLDMLWSTPTPDNWLTLVGIVGHAFISSGLIAASFIYYSKGMEFMQEMVRRETAKKDMPQATLN